MYRNRKFSSLFTLNFLGFQFCKHMQIKSNFARSKESSEENTPHNSIIPPPQVVSQILYKTEVCWWWLQLPASPKVLLAKLANSSSPALWSCPMDQLAQWSTPMDQLSLLWSSAVDQPYLLNHPVCWKPYHNAGEEQFWIS